MMKRIFSLLLALVLVVSCLPVSAFAEGTEGEGSALIQDEAAKAAAEKAAAEKAAAEKAAAEKAAAEKAAAEKAAAEKAAAEKAAAEKAAAEKAAAEKAAAEKAAAEKAAAEKAAAEEAAKKAAEEEAAKKAAEEEAAKKAAEEEAARKAAAQALACTCDAKCASAHESCARCKEYYAYCGFVAKKEEPKEDQKQEEGKKEEVKPVCDCTAKCTEANENCALCKENFASCGFTDKKDEPAEEEKKEEKPTCDCDDKCTEANENCAVCKDDFASCTGMTEEEKAAAQKAAADKAAVEAVQKLIDDLPDTVTLENKEETGNQLNAIIKAVTALEEALQSQVDLTKYNVTIAAMYELENMAGAQEPVTAQDWKIRVFDSFAKEDVGGLPVTITGHGINLTLENYGTISGAVANREYSISIPSGRGYQLSSGNYTGTIVTNPGLSILNVFVFKEYDLTITVEDSLGKPVDAWVVINGVSSNGKRTGDAGVVTLKARGKALNTISVTYKDNGKDRTVTKQFDMPGYATNLSITVPLKRNLTINLKDEAGQPLSGATVTVNDGRESVTLTENNGSYTGAVDVAENYAVSVRYGLGYEWLFGHSIDGEKSTNALTRDVTMKWALPIVLDSAWKELKSIEMNSAQTVSAHIDTTFLPSGEKTFIGRVTGNAVTVTNNNHSFNIIPAAIGEAKITLGYKIGGIEKVVTIPVTVTKGTVNNPAAPALSGNTEDVSKETFTLPESITVLDSLTVKAEAEGGVVKEQTYTDFTNMTMDFGKVIQGPVTYTFTYQSSLCDYIGTSTRIQTYYKVIKDSDVSLEVTELPYKDSPQRPAATVTGFDDDAYAVLCGTGTGSSFREGETNDAGSYTVRIAANESKYYKGTVDKTFVINKRPLRVAAYPVKIIYGEPMPAKNHYEIRRGELVGAHKEEVTLIPSTTNVTDSGSVTPEIRIMSGDRDVTANYSITADTAKLIIEKRPLTNITFSPAGITKVYDGKNTVTSDVEFECENKHGSDTVVISAGSIFYDSAAAGENKTVTASGFTVSNPNYTVEAIADMPVSATGAKITQRPVTIDVQDLALSFTGNPRTNEAAQVKATDNGTSTEVLKRGGKYEANLGTGGMLTLEIPSHTLTNVAEGPVTMEAKNITFSDGRENYDLTLRSGAFSLTPDETAVAVIADSAARQYDGLVLTAAGATINGEKCLTKTLDNGMVVNVSVSGSITDVGTADNVAVVTISKDGKVLYKSNDDTLKANFSSVTITNGTLEVKPNPAAISITADSAEKEYDGTSLTKASATVTIGGDTFAVIDSSNGTGKLIYSLTNGHTLTVALKSSSTITDLGEVVNAIESVTIQRGSKDVTGFFTGITTTDGKLTVEKSSAPIAVTAKSLKKYYDNEVLKACAPEVTVGTATGTVPAAAITKGTAVTEGNVTTIPLSTGDKLVITVEGEITAPGNVANAITECKILRGTEDVTDFYTMTTENGELEIVPNPTPIVIKADGAQKTYDAKALSCQTATVTIGIITTPEGYAAAKPITLTKAEFKDGKNYFTLSTGQVIEAVVDSSCTVTDVQRDADGRVVGVANELMYSVSGLPSGLTPAECFSGLIRAAGELKILPYEIEIIVNEAVLARLDPYHKVVTAKQSPAAKNVSREDEFKYITVKLRGADGKIIKKLPGDEILLYTVEREIGYHPAILIGEPVGKYDITELTVVNGGDFDLNNYYVTFDLDEQYIIKLRFEDTFDDGGVSDQVTTSLGGAMWGSYYATPVSLKEMEKLEAEGKDYVVPLAAETNYLIGEVHYSRQDGRLFADVRLTGNPFQGKPVEANKETITVHNVMFLYKNYRPSLYDVDKLEWTKVNMLDKDADVSKVADEKALLSGSPVKEDGKDTYIMFYDEQLQCYRMIIDLGEMPEGREKFWVFLSLDAVISEKLLTHSFKLRTSSEEYKFFRKFN